MGIVAPGEIARYEIQVDGAPNTSLVYEWSVSAGTIKKGQGSDAIEIIQPDRCVTVSVKVGGLPGECPDLFSEMSCGHPPPMAEKVIDQPGILNKSGTRAIHAAIEKNQQAGMQLYIIVYAATEKTVTQRIDAFKKLLVRDLARTTFLMSKSKDERVVIWAVPLGAAPPLP
jgi:hypothetical protein